MSPKQSKLILLVSLLGSLGCSDPEVDSGCPPSDGEFGLAGCAVLAGQVFGNLGQPIIRDSVEALLTFSPVGALPDTTNVEITLPIP